MVLKKKIKVCLFCLHFGTKKLSFFYLHLGRMEYVSKQIVKILISGAYFFHKQAWSYGSINFDKWGQSYIIKIYIKLYKHTSVQKLYKLCL